MNLFESLLMFIRDGIARPAIGGHGADAHLPFLWTLFFFILFNNLLGMIPGGASPTGNIGARGQAKKEPANTGCQQAQRAGKGIRTPDIQLGKLTLYH